MERSQLAKGVVEYLRERAGEIVAHRDLYEAVWGVPAVAGFRNTLRATISLARLDLGSGKIHSVYGVGYFYWKDADGRARLDREELT